MAILSLQLCLLMLLLFAWNANSLIPTSVIRTSSGPVQGIRLNFKGLPVDRYLGIPFAEPPIGRLRFRKTQPVKPWREVLEAFKIGPACMQDEEYHYPWYDDGSKSEDCLHLNIWVPRLKAINNNNERKPVMFWIYGGAFSDGSNKLPVYNGLALAAEGNVIVVTTNYRVSTLGFLMSGTDTAPGNVGLYDLVESLKWVNQNINAFGGDRDQVTLFGESAGAVLIGYICISPLTGTLFNRVILESGSPAYISVENNTANNIDKSQKIAEVLGCADDGITIYNDPDKVVDCLRDKSALDLVKAVSSFRTSVSQSFQPNYGDDILPVTAREALNTGQFHNVDVLIGNNRDEGSLYLPARNPEFFGAFGKKNPTVSKELGISILKDYFKNFPAKDEAIQYYLKNVTENDYDEVREQVYTAMGDFRNLCPTKYFAESYSRYQNNVYYYFYVHRSSISPWARWMKVAHFDEVEFVFGIPLLNPRNYTLPEVHLSSRMIKIWTNFAKYGDPESPDHSEYPESDWPLYSKEDPVYVTLGIGITKDRKGYGQGPHKMNCDFFRPYFEL